MCTFIISEHYKKKLKETANIEQINELKSKIVQIKKGEINYLLIRNLPIGNIIPDTPIYEIKKTNTKYADELIINFAKLIGVPYNKPNRIKIYSELVHNLYPLNKIKYCQLGGSSNFLDWHIEDAFLHESPDWFILLCIRSDNNVKTLLSDIKDLKLDNKTLEILTTNTYHIEYDDTFIKKYKGYYGPILSNKNLSIAEIKIDFPFTYAKTIKEIEALSKLKKELINNSISVTLQEGDMLIINNKKIVHARSEYLPDYNGSGRWIKRIMIKKGEK